MSSLSEILFGFLIINVMLKNGKKKSLQFFFYNNMMVYIKQISKKVSLAMTNLSYNIDC